MTPEETREFREMIAAFKETAEAKYKNLTDAMEDCDAENYEKHKIAQRRDVFLRHIEDLNVIGRKLNDMCGIPNPEQAD